MNFVSRVAYIVRILKNHVLLALFLSVLFSIYLVGCSDQVRLPSPEGLVEFENAGPTRPTVDLDRLVRARMGGGPYRLVSGDVLQLNMPTVLHVVMAESLEASEQVTSYTCRVSDSGTITLPIVGEIEVVGKTLAEIESVIIAAYHPKYVGTRPSVLAQVAEYRTAEVSITGAVKNPGVYELRSDKMSLVALLMEAGGIIDEGAAVIRINHLDETVAANEEAPTEIFEEMIEDALQMLTHRLDKQVIEQLDEPQYTEAAVPPASYRGTKQIEAQLTFAQQVLPGRRSRPIIRHNEMPLFTEQMYIAGETQRQTLPEKSAWEQPRALPIEMGQNVRALPAVLKPAGTGRTNSETEVAYVDVNSNAKLNESFPNRNSISHEALIKDVREILELEKRLGMWKAADSGKLKELQPLVLPVKGLNIPFADVALRDGDTVEVERLELPLFTVIGLVNKPGNFPYSPDVKYNLMQALAFAGGLYQAAEPRYATVYRLKPDGTIVSAPFQLVKDSKLTDALNTLIKPGDIIAVEHTPRTRTKLFLDRVFRINFGVYLPLDLLGTYER